MYPNSSMIFPPVGYPTTNVYSMGSVSNYESTWSPLKNR
jgi:hypothetical protein